MDRMVDTMLQVITPSSSITVNAHKQAGHGVSGSLVGTPHAVKQVHFKVLEMSNKGLCTLNEAGQ